MRAQSPGKWLSDTPHVGLTQYTAHVHVHLTSSALHLRSIWAIPSLQAVQDAKAAQKAEKEAKAAQKANKAAAKAATSAVSPRAGGGRASLLDELLAENEASEDGSEATDDTLER